MSYRTFVALIQNLEPEVVGKAVGIMDEFDSVLFRGDISLQEASKELPKLDKLIGFSGSELKEFHIKAAE